MSPKGLKVQFETVRVFQKLFPPKIFNGEQAIAEIHSRCVYVCGGKWCIKGSALHDVLVDGECITLRYQDNKIELEFATDKFDKFCEKCKTLKERYDTADTTFEPNPLEDKHKNKKRSKTLPPTSDFGTYRNNILSFREPRARRHGVFGRAGRSTKSNTNKIPWDDDEIENVCTTKKEQDHVADQRVDHLMEVVQTSEEKPERCIFDGKSHVSNDDVEPPGFRTFIDRTNVTPIHKEIPSNVTSQVTKKRVRKFRSKRLISDSDDDTDKDSIFSENNKDASEYSDLENNTDNYEQVMEPTAELQTTENEETFDLINGQGTLTISAAHTIVSPTGSELVIAKESEPNETTNTAPSLVRSQNQASISSFFKLRKVNGKTSSSSSKSLIHHSPEKIASPNQKTPQLEAKKRPLKTQEEWLIRSPATSTPLGKSQREHLFGKQYASPVQTHVSLLDKNDDTSLNEELVPEVPQTSLAARLFKRPRLPIQDTVDNFADKEEAHRKRSTPNSDDIKFDKLAADPFVDDSPFRGLRNLGNTCYLNSSLQMVFSCTALFASLKGLGGVLVKSVLEIADKCNSTHQRETLEMNSFSTAINPLVVKQAMDLKTDKFVGYEQRDAHEFLNDLIDHMHEEVTEAQTVSIDGVESNVPTNDFCLHAEVGLKCTSCGYTRSKNEMYRNLSLDIVESPGSDLDGLMDNASIEKGLQCFFQAEVRELNCEKCLEGSQAMQTLRVISRPKYLLLHLKRFLVIEKQGRFEDEENQSPNVPSKPPCTEYVFQKNKSPVSIPSSLSLSAFQALPNTTISKAEENSEQLKLMESKEYVLQSIVHHVGGRASSGHYTTDAIRHSRTASRRIGSTENDATSSRCTDSDSAHSNWVHFDDGYTSQTNLEKILKSKQKQATAYMLLYSLKQEDPIEGKPGAQVDNK